MKRRKNLQTNKKSMTTTKKEKTESKKKASVVAKVKSVKKVLAVKKPKAVKKVSVKAQAIKRVKEIRPKVKPVVKKEKITAQKIQAIPVEHPMPVKPQVPQKPLAPQKPQQAPIEKKIEVQKIAVTEIKPAAEIKKETPVAQVAAPAAELKELELEFPVIVKDLAVKLQEKPSVLIKTLMDMRVMAGINHTLQEETVSRVCEKFGYKIKKALGKEELTLQIHAQEDKPQDLRQRPAIVTLMGHVDHGKTSLLDAIRKTRVVDSEHGGITQHIGAYRVSLPHGEITFLDTPGHEAFTAMRARGASITDIVILVVAADDGVMPQTQEAIDHARAAGVSIIVALNKIDKPQANIDKIKKQLSELGLNPEDWGGKTITVPVSAKNGTGIDDLLEMVLLEAQMLELKANPNRPAKGVVIEAKMSKGRGPVSTLLIQNGTLRLNENIIVGQYYGKIRAMSNHLGHSVTEAPPSFPVEVLGISGIPAAGEQFFAIEDEKTAKELALKRQEQERQKQVKSVKRVSLEDLHAQIQEGKIKELKLIIKADVQGSLEAIKDTLNKLNVTEIKMDFIHTGVGNINASDVILAIASNALILGFNTVADELAKELAVKEGVDIKIYNIIYELANEIKAALEGMLEPKLKKNFLGKAEVRKVFKLSRSGIIAGCFVSKGKFTRTCPVSLLRNGEVIFEGKLSSLKRFKDDVREVAEGYECGMALSGFDNLQEGDIIEAYEIEKILRKL